MAKGKVEIDRERCKGCGLCLTVCPQHVLALADDLNLKGYHPATLIDPDGKCTGCAICAVICPDVCITVFRDIPVRKREVAVI